MAGGDTRGRTWVLMGAEKQILLDNIVRETEITETNQSLICAVLLLLMNGQRGTNFGEVTNHINEIKRSVMGSEGTPKDLEIPSAPLSKQFNDIKKDFNSVKRTQTEINKLLKANGVNLKMPKATKTSATTEKKLGKLTDYVRTLSEKITSLSNSKNLTLMADRQTIVERKITTLSNNFIALMEHHNLLTKDLVGVKHLARTTATIKEGTALENAKIAKNPTQELNTKIVEIEGRLNLEKETLQKKIIELKSTIESNKTTLDDYGEKIDTIVTSQMNIIQMLSEE